MVGDLRSADVVAGGQGAPLMPVYHRALANELRKPTAILNLGGVAPVSGEVGPGQVLSNTYAVDTIAPVLDPAASTPAAGATRVA